MHLQLSFPDNFIFGSSVSAFQVEGNLSNERKTDWDLFLDRNPYHIIRPGEVGPDWWSDIENIDRDLKTVSSIGVTMQRLSIEWGRIEPEHGQIDKNALQKYRQIIDLCKRNNLMPMVTINHFTLPAWAMKRGGWENPQIVVWIKQFAEILLEEFGDVTHWIIINEPSSVVYMGYLLGIFPPNKKSIISVLKVRKNLINAQREVYALIKNKAPNAQVGNAFSFLWLRHYHKSYRMEKLLTRTLNNLINTNFVSATKDYMDFLGMNFYTGYYLDLKLSSFFPTMRNEAVYVPHHLPFGRTVRPKTYKTDMGWPIVPDFFLDALKHIYKAYKKPIFITENGIADRDDIYRSFYILTHMVSLLKAMEGGVKILGYIHWATIDNLEWAEGYAKRFGLIEVNPITGQRQLRKGAKVLEEIIKEQGISNVEKMIDEFIPEEQKEYARRAIQTLLESTPTHCPRII